MSRLAFKAVSKPVGDKFSLRNQRTRTKFIAGLKPLVVLFSALLLLPDSSVTLAAENRLNISADAPPSPNDSLEYFGPISNVDVDIRLEGEELPADRAIHLFGPEKPYSQESENRAGWYETQFQWQPTELFYKPLYFDDVALERYGQTYNEKLEPFFSGARFFGGIGLMPYKLAIDHPRGHITPLGFHRPGNCTWQIGTKPRRRVDPLWWHWRNDFWHCH